MNKIRCKLCKNEYSRITNTHLFTKHQLTMEEYRNMFPDSPIDVSGLVDQGVNHVSEKCSKYERSDDLIHSTTNYRARALEFYGLECARCGFESGNSLDFSVHHKDLVNISSELGNRDLESLQVLCKSCYAKLHKELDEVSSRFTGIDAIEKGVHYIFKGLKQEFGLDLLDENFRDTPKRVARAYREIFAGLKNTEEQIDSILATSFPSEGYESMIFCPDVISFSMCPHHFLPVEYQTTIAYIPSKEGRVLGASKLARIIDVLSQRPVLQETLTQDIVKAFEKIKPIGSAVVVSGTHFCMKMRGIKKQTSYETSAMSGIFMDDPAARKEFFDLLQLSRTH